jgi:hypothetical protein
MKRWLWIIGVLWLGASLVLAFDCWRREPYRQRARFDAVEIGMTKDQIIEIMGTENRVVFRRHTNGARAELPCLTGHRIRGPRFRDDPFVYHFYLDEHLVLQDKEVVAH